MTRTCTTAAGCPGHMKVAGGERQTLSTSLEFYNLQMDCVSSTHLNSLYRFENLDMEVVF